MRYAVVLSGYFSTISTGKIDSGLISEKKIKNFFKYKEVDYFIHTWQPEKHGLLCELYNPKKIISEPQIDFKQIMDQNGLSQEWFDEGFDRKNSGYSRALIDRSLSFLYSRKQALNLVDRQYDRVFTMRLDIGNVGPDSVNFPHRFNFSSDPSKVYSVYWEQLNCGLGDMWFITNTDDSKILSTAYESALEDYKPNSQYSKSMITGWPDSEWFDFESNDPRQFSNIITTKKNTGYLMKYPKWYCVNNHSFYKFFFIKTGLYNRMVLI